MMVAPHKWDGTISARDFLEAARTFSERWVEVNPNLPPWMWVSQPVISGSAANVIGLEGCSFDEEPDVDCATLVQNDNPGAHFYDYHILYSYSYNVPVLYFRGYQCGGQTLLLEEVKGDFPSSSLDMLTEYRWTFLTTEDHPFLHRPWHMLHPCGTRDWMKLLFSGSSHQFNDHRVAVLQKYIPSWLSVVGQVVGLKVPLGIHAPVKVNISPLTGEAYE